MESHESWTVLSVDDDPLIHALVKGIVRSMPVEVHTAGDGPEAIELARRLRPDLVLLDYELPSMNGLQVLRELQAAPELAQTPVMFMTGSESNDVLATCFAHGAVDYVRKPLRGPEFRARVGAVLDRHRMTRQLQAMAYTDPLTGLANRNAFRNRLDQLIDESPEGTLALVFLDFDHFKLVNDSLGHPAGDALLGQIARRLTEGLRAFAPGPDAFVARLGGDEFAAVLPDLEGFSGALALTEELLELLSEPYVVDGRDVVSTASAGIVFRTSPAQRADELLRDADTAMYEAKRAGRGRYVVFDPRMHEAVEHRLGLEVDLRSAIARNEFEVYYQPIIDLRTARVHAVEALIRWNHPSRGRVSPADFIPLAEETGLIVPIGAWVLSESCAAMARWRRELGSLAPEAVHVNLSRRQLVLPNLVEQVDAVLRQYGIPPEALHLEVTENEIMKDRNGAIHLLRNLRALGVKVDMDDFGTGYSSLACLKEFPLDVLKIDQSFLVNVENQRSFAALLQAITSLARNLDLTVVAEGIETKSQLAALQALDCDYGQGYYFARPLPEAELVAYLQESAPDVLASTS